MKAVICTKYGSADVLQLGNVPKPMPRDNEVLIKVYAASVTTADGMMRQGKPFYGRLFLGLTKPKNPVPGTGFAGKIESIGKNVNNFTEGDAVFGETGVTFGANAEYVCIPADEVLSLKPSTISYAEAAPVCDGALTSLIFLRDIAKLQPGQHVLINGASGSLGTSAIQLAHNVGAEVTGVGSTANIDLVKSLGADKVIDYTQQDFTKTGETYDVIFDTVGKSSFSQCKNALTDNGLYLSPVLKIPLLLQMAWTSKFGDKKVRFSATGLRPASERLQFLEELKDLLEKKKIKSVMDRQYPLQQAIAAHRYVDQGHKKGNVVITMTNGEKPEAKP